MKIYERGRLLIPKEDYADIQSRDRRTKLSAFMIVLFLLCLLMIGLQTAEFSLAQIIQGFSKLGLLISLMFPPSAGPNLRTYIGAMGETLSIAFLGTLIASIFAFPISVLASRNIIPVWIFRFSLRRFFDTIRGVDTLIWALIWIGVVGLGPFAGVLAIAISDFGALSRLFSDTIETADQKPVEGIRSTGGSRFQEFWFAVLPQVFPTIAGQMLYFFESNTRSATIIGIVGAGGIGLHLSEQIHSGEWTRVSFIIMMIMIVVSVIDYISSRLRQSITGPVRTT
jgi:phosphonate transport system permease protein